MNYEYCEHEEGASQYEEGAKRVKALYIRSNIESDRGNCFLEALPPDRSDSATRRANTIRFLEYDRDKVKGMNPSEKMDQVDMLRTIRAPLPSHIDLSRELRKALLTSYRARCQTEPVKDSVEIVVDGKEAHADQLLVGDSADATSAGFGLIGFSGAGKSSSIKAATSYYPQVIEHEIDGCRFIQITYLVVNCAANSNFVAIYVGFGDALDKAVGNNKPVYAKEIAKLNSLAKMADKVKELIEKFAIGVLILDEIQLINFDSMKENSYDALTTLCNKTKIGLGIVGTEDALNKMFTKARRARRIGRLINGSDYCANRDYFDLLIGTVFEYQWFDEPVSVTDDIADALFEVTHGLVDQLIGIYSYMNYDYIMKDRKPEINGKYVRYIANKYFPGMQNVLASMDENEDALDEIKESAAKKLELMRDKLAQEAETKTLIANREAATDEGMLLRNVAENIHTIYEEYTNTDIEKAFNKVMNKKNSEGRGEREITRMVVDALQKEPKKRVPKTQAPKAEQMENFLGIMEGDNA